MLSRIFFGDGRSDRPPGSHRDRRTAGPPEVATITFDRDGMILEELGPSVGRRSGG